MKKHQFISIIIAILIAPAIAIAFFQKPVSAPEFGELTKDTLTAKTCTYTTFTASTTAAKALSIKTDRVSLLVQNTAATSSARVFLQATSTGVASTTGVVVLASSSYSPNFIWPGEVYVITPTGSAGLVIQECSTK